MYIKRGINVGNHGYSVDVPDACPVCHRHSEVEFIRADRIDGGAGVQAIFRCAYAQCRQFFLCYYGQPNSAEVVSVRPVKPVLSQFSEAVAKVSPSFVEIFSQAEEAAQLGLAQVAGPGYRKAFEFLIKDYAKSLAPDESKTIENMFSGAVVEKFIPDKRIQAVAKRTLWLGNDETHYLKKWNEMAIGDLVTLIKLTSHWIDIAKLSDSYIEAMPE